MKPGYAAYIYIHTYRDTYMYMHTCAAKRKPGHASERIKFVRYFHLCMYVCTCICIHILIFFFKCNACVYVYIYIYIYIIYIYIYIYDRICIEVLWKRKLEIDSCMYLSVCVRMYSSMYVCKSKSSLIRMCIYMWVCVCVHACKHT